MKIEFDKVGTWIVIYFLFLALFFLLLLKILGASDIPKQFVEKNGYCRTEFGLSWDYDENNDSCRNGLKTENFSMQNFENVCPDHKFFSKGFYSDCFKAGRGG